MSNKSISSIFEGAKIEALQWAAKAFPELDISIVYKQPLTEAGWIVAATVSTIKGKYYTKEEFISDKVMKNNKDLKGYILSAMQYVICLIADLANKKTVEDNTKKYAALTYKDVLTGSVVAGAGVAETTAATTYSVTSTPFSGFSVPKDMKQPKLDIDQLTMEDLYSDRIQGKKFDKAATKKSNNKPFNSIPEE